MTFAGVCVRATIGSPSKLRSTYPEILQTPHCRCRLSSSASFRLRRRWSSSGLGQRHLRRWLCSLTREWQSLWHFTHMKVDGCCGWYSLFFRLAFFSARISFLASSPTCTPFLTAKRHNARSSASLSQERTSIWHCFRPLLHTSL